MRTSTILLILLFAVHLHAQKIKAYEYWVDDDASTKVYTSITPVKNFHLQQALSVDMASPGFHIFNIRFVDTTNTWSVITSQYFVKNPTATSNNRQIVAYEYWVDDNTAFRIYQAVTPSSQFHLTDPLNMSSVSFGFHVLSIRFKDDMGNWSSTLTHSFVKNPVTSSTNRQIVAYEYWVDDNTASRIYQAITPSSQFHLTDPLNISSVSFGFHVLSIRFKDDMGNWSTTLTQYFTKFGASKIIPEKIVSYRFWFDDDMTSQEILNLQQPASVCNWADTVETPFLTIGNHTISYQFKDSSQIFSSIRTDTFNVLSCLPHGGRVISGTPSVCPGQSGVGYSIRNIKNATSYTWSLPPGASIIAGSNTNSITVNFSTSALSGDVSVYATNSCGSGDTMIYPVTIQTPTITGPQVVCTGTTGVTYSTQAGMTSYFWILSAGGTITSGAGTSTITVNWNVPGNQTVSLSYTNSNGCNSMTPASYNVTVNASPVPAITGPASVNANSTGSIYTTQTGMTSYLWTVSSGGTITAGSGTQAITVSWNNAGPQTVSVNFINSNGCNAITPTSFNVTVNGSSGPPNWIPIPNPQFNMSVIGKIQLSPGVYSLNENDIVGAFVGSECRGVANPFTSLGGALFLTIGSNVQAGEIVTFKIYRASSDEIADANENIVFQNGGEVGTMASPFIFTFGPQCTLSVTPPNRNIPSTGGSATFNVVAPSVCNWTAVSNQTWCTPTPSGGGNGTITANCITNPNVFQRIANITVTISGIAPVIVTVTQAGFQGPPNWEPVPNLQYNMNVIGKIQLSLGVFSLNENDKVGAFVGTECRGVASPFSSLSGSLFLTIGSNLQSGEIVIFKIYLASTDEIVDANENLPFQNGGEVGTMADPAIFTFLTQNALFVQGITITSGQTKCYNAFQTITVAGSGTSFLVQNGGSVTMIAGQKISILPGTSVLPGGQLKAYITTTGSYCNSLPSSMIYGMESEEKHFPDIREHSLLNIYPNPTTGNFILEMKGVSMGYPVSVYVYDSWGERVLTALLNDQSKHEFSLSSRPIGIYFIRVIYNNNVETAKIIKY